MSVLPRRHPWRIVAIVAAFFFVYGSVLVRLSQTWWVDENYSHGLLIPFIIAFVLWKERDTLLATQSRPLTFWGGAAILLALFVLWTGVAGAELYMQRLSLVLMIVGTIVYFWGAHLLRLLWMPLSLLLLAIPIPTIVFNQIAFPLQLFASQCAVASMRLFNIPVLRQGNVIELLPLNSLETKKLEVVEACSGIRSLMTLVTLALVFAYFSYPQAGNGSGQSVDDSRSASRFAALRTRGFWRSLLIVLSAVPIAIFTNALRVSGTGVLSHYYGTRVADGFFHSFSGWLIYVAAFLMLFAFGWLLDRLGAIFSRRSGVGSEPLQQGQVIRPSVSVVGRLVQPERTD